MPWIWSAGLVGQSLHHAFRMKAFLTFSSTALPSILCPDLSLRCSAAGSSSSSILELGFLPISSAWATEIWSKAGTTHLLAQAVCRQLYITVCTARLTFLLAAAIYGVVSYLACVAPKMTFQLYGIIPIPAWLAVAGIFSYDTYSAIKDKVQCLFLSASMVLTAFFS